MLISYQARRAYWVVPAMVSVSLFLTAGCSSPEKASSVPMKSPPDPSAYGALLPFPAETAPLSSKPSSADLVAPSPETPAVIRPISYSAPWGVESRKTDASGTTIIACSFDHRQGILKIGRAALAFAIAGARVSMLASDKTGNLMLVTASQSGEVFSANPEIAKKQKPIVETVGSLTAYCHDLVKRAGEAQSAYKRHADRIAILNNIPGGIPGTPAPLYATNAPHPQ